MANATNFARFLRSGHAKVALAAAVGFVPVVALMLLNGPGGVGEYAQREVVAPLRLALFGPTPDELAEAARAERAQQRPTIFDVARAARAEAAAAKAHREAAAGAGGAPGAAQAAAPPAAR